MSLEVNLYDSRSLTQAINKIPVTEPFVLDKIFWYKDQHDSDKIDIEITEGSSKIAQPVNRNEQEPRPVKQNTKKIESVNLPRTYECKVFTVQELKDIGVAGGIYASAADRKRAQADKVAFELAELKERVLRLREKMAVDVISKGKIELSGNNVEFKIDFGFSSEAGRELVTLTGDDLWTATASKPLVQLRKWKGLIKQKAYQVPTICLLGSDAAAAFIDNTQVLKALDNLNNKVGSIDLNSDGSAAATWIGRLLGIDFYEYNQQYTNTAGAKTDMFDSKRAVLCAPGNTNRLHFGPAERIGQNGEVIQYNGEFFLEIDPKSNNKGLQWNCEQKSLPAIHDIGCFISAKVIA